MPWEHCDQTLLDTVPACPSCGMGKEQWTVEFQVTREFRLQRKPAFRAEVLTAETDEPVTGLAYRLEVEGEDPVIGELDENGYVRVKRDQAAEGRLVFPGLSAECLEQEGEEEEGGDGSAAGGDGEGDRGDEGERDAQGAPDEATPDAAFSITTARKLGLRARFRLDLELRLSGRPLPDTDYSLELPDGDRAEGRSDEHGRLSCLLPGAPERVVLHVTDPSCSFPLRVRPLPPSSEPAGAQLRLNALGWGCGPADGELGPRAAAALRRFQRAQGLEESGELDADTQSALTAAFGY